ncbi:MAG: NTP transferase domain-containing protein [Muribaculaceae bacterium]|nr:NTP transferase domain-containing protein [Muribaculaceae bacterium]
MNHNRYLIPSGAALLDALARLNSLSGGPMTLFVTDEAGRVTGSLTDGDVRRALLAGMPLDCPVDRAARRDFSYISTDHPDVELLRECRRKGLRLLPELRPDGTLSRIVNLDRTTNLLPLSAVLMAGGKGERLRPLTLNTPKPLLQIEGKAIIDYNIEALAAVGIDRITVTTRYLAEQLDRHFSAPVAGVQVHTVREEQPLGTIGAVSLIDLPDDGDTLVMNSDILTTISFEDLYIRHRESGADVTIAAIPYQVSVPFAILSTEGERVTGLQEKPTYAYFANAGIYIFRNSILRSISRDTPTDAPDLIARVIDEGGHVGYFPVNGTWLDVGTPADFAQAAELMRHHKNFSRR